MWLFHETFVVLELYLSYRNFSHIKNNSNRSQTIAKKTLQCHNFLTKCLTVYSFYTFPFSSVKLKECAVQFLGPHWELSTALGNIDLLRDIGVT